METREFKVKGMHCASCVLVVERAIKKQGGVSSVLVNLATETATVSYDPSLFSERIMAKTIEKKGYKLATGKEKSDSSIYLGKFLLSLIFTLPVFVLSMFVPHGAIANMHFILLVLTIPVQFVIGFEFYKKAFISLKSFSATMDTLVALGTSAAFFYSVYLIIKGSHAHLYFETSAVLISVILLGRFLEAKAKSEGAEAVKKLMGLFPKTAFVIRHGAETEISINDIVKGDVIVLKPGGRAPSDGTATEGSADMDESAVTGEPMTVPKAANDKVISGSVLVNGSLKYTAEKVGSDSTLSGIITMVSRAQASKPQSQKLADTIAFYFVPVVISVAALTFTAWFLYDKNFEHALTCAVAVLVVACPCALGLATPAAVIAGTSRAARYGVIVKDSQALESAAKASDVVFDKTGTLTFGKPEVKDVNIMDEKNTIKVLTAMASLCAKSSHPVAREVFLYATRKGIVPAEVPDFLELPGCGVRGTVSGIDCVLGNYDGLKKMGLNVYIFTKTASSTCLVMDHEPAAEVIFSDAIRPQSAQAVSEIEKLGLTCHIVTGDSEAAAVTVAAQAGIRRENVFSRALPSDKQQYVRALKAAGEKVIFAGDGINDAAALATADCGAAFAGGTDIAAEAGNCLLMRNDPMAVYELIQTGRLTVNKIKQNLFWAFFYNVLGIPLAALGLLNPMIAGTAMALSSVSVLLNSLMMKK